MKKIILLLAFLTIIPIVIRAKKTITLPEKVQRVSIQKKDPKKAKLHDILSKKNSLTKLTKLRRQIDDIDYQILHKIAKRMQFSQEIGKYKRNNGMRVLQSNRWNEVLKSREAFAKKMGLDTLFTINLLELIHHESIRKQTELIK